MNVSILHIRQSVISTFRCLVEIRWNPVLSLFNLDGVSVKLIFIGVTLKHLPKCYFYFKLGGLSIDLKLDLHSLSINTPRSMAQRENIASIRHGGNSIENTFDAPHIHL